MNSNALATMPIEKMLQRIEGAKFPQQMSPPEKKMLAEAAIIYELDPVMGELMLYQGHLFVSIDGRYRKAQETGLLAGVETRPATLEERTAWQIPDEDYFFRSEVYVQGIARPFVGWGRVRKAETEPPRDPSKRGYRPLETNPQRMAEKRAEAQALRKAFHIPLPSAETIGEEGPYADAILGEAHELPVDEAPPDVDRGTGEVHPPTSAADATRSEEAPADPEGPQFRNIGELLTACHQQFGLAAPEVYKAIGVKGQMDIGDLADAWVKVCAAQENKE